MASSSKRERSPDELAANVRRKPQLAAQSAGSRDQHYICRTEWCDAGAFVSVECIVTVTVISIVDSSCHWQDDEQPAVAHVSAEPSRSDAATYMLR